VRQTGYSSFGELIPAGAMSVPMSGDNFPRRYSIVAETRRKWSDREKQAIVAEAAQPGANISAVARRHGIKPSLLFRWRRRAREGQRSAAAPAFLPVTLALPPACSEPVSPEASPAPSSPLPAALPDGEEPDDRIEIELGNGRLVRVGAGVSTDALKRIIDLLDRPGSNGTATCGRQRR
jgi:transposase